MLTLLLASAALADEPAVDEVSEDPIPVEYRHGFRLGWTYFENEELDYPHLFVMGYETSQRLAGGAGLDVLVVENAMVAGLNQSLFLPSANVLIGASVHDRFEVGVGPNLSLIPELSTNMIAAAGVTVPAGRFEIPLHVSWVSAADDWGRVAFTTGVNWGSGT